MGVMNRGVNHAMAIMIRILHWQRRRKSSPIDVEMGNDGNENAGCKQGSKRFSFLIALAIAMMRSMQTTINGRLNRKENMSDDKNNTETSLNSTPPGGDTDLQNIVIKTDGMAESTQVIPSLCVLSVVDETQSSPQITDSTQL